MTNDTESTNDEMYMAKMTMDEVGADIEAHGHVSVTDENRTQDPFTNKGALANALDEALDFSNPNYDPTNETQGEVEGVTQDPQKTSQTEVVPDDPTLDKAPEVPETMLKKGVEAKDVKDALAEELESVTAMDAITDVPGEADDEAHHRWEAEEIKKNVPQVPESMGGGDKPDSNGLIYLDYTFTVDPSKYRSPNYQPIGNAGEIGNSAPNAGKDPNGQAANDKVDENISVEETIVETGGEPSKDAEKVAAKEANENEKEVASIGKPIDEKKAEDEAPEKVVLDYATFIDGSSFQCCDDVDGIDYSRIAMDAGPKKPVTRQTCKTTFAQCRAKNPLFCRFHGPKLLEKDIKSAISSAVGKGCVVSVTKDKGQKNPLTFRLTIGCPPAMKKNVENIVHMFMTQNPGISSPEEYKDLGNGKQTTEFDMDILKADEPPKKNDLKGQAAQWEVEKAKAKGKTMPVVGETPPKVEKLANEGGVQKTDVQQPPVEEEVEEKVEEKVEQPVSTTSIEKEASEAPSTKGGNFAVNEEVENNEKQKEFSALVDKAIDEGYFKNEQFQNEYDGIVADVGKDAASMEQKTEALKALMEKYKPEGAGDKGQEQDKKESALATVKEALKGTKYEDSKCPIVVAGDGYEFNIASTDDDISLYAYVDADNNIGFGVNDNGEHISEKSLGDAIQQFEKLGGGPSGGKKEATLAKIKDVLGKGFEDGDQQIDLVKSLWDIVSEADSDDDLAKDIRATLLDVMELDEEGYPTIDKDIDVGNYDSPMIYAIHQIQSLVDKQEDGLDDSQQAPEGFHFVDDAAMKMTGEIDDLAHRNPELISSDDQASALYYGAQQAINGLDLYKQGLEEIDAKLKEFEGKEADGLSASDVLAKLTLKNSKKAQQEAYDDAKAQAELAVKDFKEAVEKAKENVVDAIKGTNAEMVENIVKTTARAIFKNGKPDGVDSVVDMIDALDEDMTSQINEKLMVNGNVSHDDLAKVNSIKDKHSFGEKYKAVSSASLEFDGAVSSFKDLIDGVKSKDGAESLKEAVNGISEYSQKLKDAFAAYKMAVENVKKEVSDLAEMKEKEKKLSAKEYSQPTKKQDNGNADPKAAIKAKIAAMSVKEKMEKSIPILEKKIKAEPNNEKWQKMLKQAKAYLASHKD